MKRSIKLSVSAFICGALLVTGCGISSTSLPSNLLGQKNAYPDAINIMANKFFDFADQDNTDGVKQKWLDEMSARYGTEFNITSATTITTKDNEITGQYGSAINSVLSGQSDFKGLVQVDSFQSLQTAIDHNMIMPLDDYLVNNPIWKSLPDDLKSTFTYQGHIYAIPSNVTRSMMYPRNIVKTALEQTGITVTDLNSLKNFAIAYTKKTGKYALSSIGFNGLRDVLNAYGLYILNSIYDNSHPFAYDPTTNCFEDFLTKDAAIDALQYLRELYTAGALDINFDYSYWHDNDQKDQYASGSYYDYNAPSEQVTLNSSYPQVLDNTVSGFAMTIGTSQPKETINLLVDMLYASKENYLECWLGSPDNYILNSDGTITVKMVQNADGRYVIPSTPDLAGGLPDLYPYSDASILYNQNGVISTDSWAGTQNKQNELMNNLLKQGKAVKVAPAYSLLNSPTFNASQATSWPVRTGSVTDLYQKCITDAITSTEYTVQQIVEQYRLDMFNMSGNKMLDEMNAAIGKKTAYYYG